MQKKIVVTGANGKLGKELQELAIAYTGFNFIFATRQELPLDSTDAIHSFIEKKSTALSESTFGSNISNPGIPVAVNDIFINSSILYY